MQSELWKKLGVSSREGSRLALGLEKKGKIERRKILHKGRWSYKMFAKKEYVTMESLKGCPCMVCTEVEKCYEGGNKDPINCKDLTAWLTPQKTE